MTRRQKAGIFAASVAGVLLTGTVGLAASTYTCCDSIDRAGWDTERRLAVYTVNGDTREMRSWLQAYHGEAPGMQVMMTLADWAPWFPTRFVALVEAMTAAERTDFVSGFGFALTDGGGLEAFRATFKDTDSAAVKAILTEVGARFAMTHFRCR